MRKHHSIGLCVAVILAGLVGPRVALGLDSSYNTTESSKISIGGLARDTSVTSGTCHFNGGGTFDLYDQSYHYTGTYTLAAKGKQVVLTIDQSSLSEIITMLADWTNALASEGGVQVSNLSFNLQSVTLSKAPISKKTNKPSKVTVTVRGKVSAQVDGSPVTKSFSYRCQVLFL